MACTEGERIKFVINQRGFSRALAWAHITKRIYRKAILDKRCHGSFREYKEKFIESYLTLKRFNQPKIIEIYDSISVPDDCKEECEYLLVTSDCNGTGDSPTCYSCSVGSVYKCPTVKEKVFEHIG